MSALEVKRLRISYPSKGQRKTVLNEVAFSLAQGEILGVIGESGSGKSTIALAIMGLLDAAASADEFEVSLGGRNLQEMSGRERRKLLGSQIAFIPQEPLAALNPTVRVGKQIDLVLRKHMAIDARSRRVAICAALERLRVPDPKRILNSHPFELSGGQIQRALIAQAIALDAPLIIADEPTTALDVTVQQEVLNDLKSVVSETNRSLLFISHSIGVVYHLCDTLLVMCRGDMVEKGRTQDIIPGSTQPYTQMLIGALPSLSPPRTPLPTGEIQA